MEDKESIAQAADILRRGGLLAIPTETVYGLGAICDATVAVTAPEEVRVKRIMARDSITEEYARSRIAAQKDADYFRAQCDYEFVNDLPTAEKAEHAAEVYINTIINNLKEETER